MPVLFAIDQFSLPVTNVLAGLGQSQFFCSGSLLRVEIKEPNAPGGGGPALRPSAVMFERNPVFDTKTGFRGKVLASYIKDRNPLLSGFLLGAELIQGKAAAIDVNYGTGPRHPAGLPAAVARASRTALTSSCSTRCITTRRWRRRRRPEARRGAAAGIRSRRAWRREAEAVKSELSRLLDQNRAYFTARGPRAAERGQDARNRARRLPARPPAAARRSARAGGGCGRGAQRSRVIRRS